MKKLIFAIVLLAFVGCGNPEQMKKKHQYFGIVEESSAWRVVYDRRTKVMYVYPHGYNTTGTFTVLVDADGKPLLWKGTIE